MNFVPLNEIGSGIDRHFYRFTAWSYLLILLMLLGGALFTGALTFAVATEASFPLSWLGAIVLGLICLITTFISCLVLRALFRLLFLKPWILCVGSSHIFIPIRYSLNWHLDAQPIRVLKLELNDIKGFEFQAKKSELPKDDPEDRGNIQQRFLKIKLDLTPEDEESLLNVLESERSFVFNDAVKNNWVAKKSPLQWEASNKSLQLQLEGLGFNLSNLKSRLISLGFAVSETRLNESFEESISVEKLKQLVVEGNEIEAIKLLKRHHGLSTTEAKKIVDRLVG